MLPLSEPKGISCGVFEVFIAAIFMLKANVFWPLRCKGSAFFWYMQEFVVIFSHKDRKTEEFSFSSPYVRGRRLTKFCLSVFLSFSNMPVAGYLTLVNEWYFFTKKSSKNLEIWEFCCIFAFAFGKSISGKICRIVRLLCVYCPSIVRLLSVYCAWIVRNWQDNNSKL